MHHGTQRDIPKIGRRPMIADQTVGEEGKGGRSGKTKPTVAVDTYATTAVGMIHKSELALVRMSLCQRRECSSLGAEGTVLCKGNRGND